MRALVFLVFLFSVQQMASGEPGKRWRDWMRAPSAQTASFPGLDANLAGRKVAIWKPELRTAPLVVFSHGLHGNRNQSSFLCRALAKAGYLVIAVEHQDAGFTSGPTQESLRNPARWTANTYRDRADDITSVIEFLRVDPVWAPQVEWSQGIALMGHSLGGYTALGLAGAWPAWKPAGCRIVAVLALSPYTSPFAKSGQIDRLGVPVMYQTGSRDLGIKPSLVRGGIYAKTQAPAYYVEFEKAGHMAWTDRVTQFQPDICRTSQAFLDRYLKGQPGVELTTRLPSMAELRVK